MEFERKIPILKPELIWDKLIEPEKVQFNILDNDNERVLGIKLPVGEFRRFAAMIARFDDKLEFELNRAKAYVHELEDIEESKGPLLLNHMIPIEEC